jgi:hypothetical protein
MVDAMSNSQIARAQELQLRARQRMFRDESPGQRLVRFNELQKRCFEVLRSSPDGFRHFLQRNYRARRTEVIDGRWRPVSADRDAC